MSNSWSGDVTASSQEEESEEESEEEESKSVSIQPDVAEASTEGEFPNVENPDGLGESDDDAVEEMTADIASAGELSGEPDVSSEQSEGSSSVSPTIGDEDAPDQSSAEPEVSEEEDEPSVPMPSGAMTLQEAAELERRWKIMVWGPPGLFKSHFCYTAPEPIAFLDLEGKADDIAGKFEGKRVAIWQPSDYYEAQDALEEALTWLEQVMDEEDKRGTIVVDSMSEMWDWAQFAYVQEAYPMDDPEEKLKDVFKNLSIGDWKWIKNKHNAEFRQRITDSPFHFVWTAGEKEDVDMESGASEIRAEGEKNNKHKADTIIHARKDSKGVKVGDMVKSNFTDRLFRGLERPTFDRVVEAVRVIEDAETNPGDYTVGDIKETVGVEVVMHDPLYPSDEEDDD